MNRMAFAAAAAGVAFTLLGCSDGVKENIRKHDFRTLRAEQRQAQIGAAAPSPIANVADMPGWTTDLQGATVFAKENGQRVLVFVQNGNTGTSQKMKTALNSAKMSDTVQKVTFDQQQSPELASQFNVTGPAVLVIDGTGNVISRQEGTFDKSKLLASAH